MDLLIQVRSIDYGQRHLTVEVTQARIEDPPHGSMFRRQTTSKAQRRCQCSCSATATASINIISSSPPREDQAQGSSLTPKSAASLRSTYIKQIKELHELFDLDAISEADFRRQKEKILEMMDSL